jgi:methionyl-tRNA synthetase
MTLIQNLDSIINSNWFYLILIWTMVWKGIALWRCGRNNQLYWFIVILIINTLGILEIIYLYFFQKKIRVPSKAEVKTKRK